MKKVLIAPSVFATPDSTPLEKLIRNGFELIKNPYGRKLTREELVHLLPGVQGLIAGLETLNRDILKSSNLRVISRCGSGISNIDLDAARELRINVFSTPEAPTNAVAELTIGAMISLIRYIPQMNSDLHNAKWTKKIGSQLEGRAVIIIGFGRIGRKIAELLMPFRVNIIAVDPDCNLTSKGVRFLSLEEALPQADIITIHAAGDRIILGRKEFAAMKNGVFLLNCARGNIIDEAELVRSLENGLVSGAWLDCFSEEPYVGPLTKYPQVILTPHVGSYTAECRKRMEMEAVDNLITGFQELEDEGI